MRRIIFKNNGVTLIELMIVLVIAAILVGGIYTLFMTQQRAYSVQDQVAGVQQDARAALNFLARDIRMAGAVVGAGEASGFTDGLTYFPVHAQNYAVNRIVNNDSDNGNDRMNGTDAIAIVYAERELGLIDSANVDPPNKTIQLYQTPSNPSSIQFVTSETHSDHVFRVTSVSGNRIILDYFPATSFAENEKVYEVSTIEYRVGRSAPGASFFVLRRVVNTDDQPLIGDDNLPIVEDLQIAYQAEGVPYWTHDGNVETGNGETDDTQLPAGKTWADIRLVRINVTVRTAVEDAVVQDATDSAVKFNQPALEDHTAGLNGPDGFRRRVYTTVVKVRNLK